MDEIINLIMTVYDQNPSAFLGLGTDPNGIASEAANRLEGLGVPANKIVGVRQGYSLLAGWTHLYRRLAKGTLTHGGQLVVDWAASNCRQSPDGLVTKKASGTSAKIDPMVALACGAMLVLNPPQPFDVGAMIASTDDQALGSSSPRNGPVFLDRSLIMFTGKAAILWSADS